MNLLISFVITSSDFPDFFICERGGRGRGGRGRRRERGGRRRGERITGGVQRGCASSVVTWGSKGDGDSSSFQVQLVPNPNRTNLDVKTNPSLISGTTHFTFAR